MAWSDPLSVEEYIAYQLAAIAFLLHKKGMKEQSQLLIGVRTEFLENIDATFQEEVKAAHEFYAPVDESTAPAR